MLGTRDDRHVKLLCECARLGLVTEALDHLGGRPHEGDPSLLTQLHKLGRFGEEAVARMDRVDIVLDGNVDDALGVEVGADGALARADQEGFVRLVTVQRAEILLAVDGHRLQVELRGSAADADGDLAAVGGEELLDGAEASLGWDHPTPQQPVPGDAHRTERERARGGSRVSLSASISFAKP